MSPKPAGKFSNLCALLISGGVVLGGVSSQAQYEHLNAGAVSSDAGAQLLWVNGALFATNAGYAQPMPYSASGPYAGFYNSGNPVLIALPTTSDNGGPAPFAAAQGSFINVQINLISAPAGGAFAFWEDDAPTPTYSLGVGDTTPLIALSDETLGAGNLGADPFGHIHGRRFSGTVKGDYVVGLQLISSDDHGPGAQPIHLPSDFLYMQFTAVPARPVLSAPFWLSNQLSMRLTGESNQNYTIQWSTNVTSTNWSSLLVTNNPAANSFLVTDPNATGEKRFYRVWVGP